MYVPPVDLSKRSFVIIGAGTLGRRIALMWMTRPDTIVHLHDTDRKTLDEAKAYIDQALRPTIDSRVPGGSPGTLKMFDNRAEALRNAWIVVDCIPEIRQAKIDLLGELDTVLPEDVIIATNSSSFMAREICEKVVKRDRVINTHYYWPPEQVPVEIMPSAETHESIVPMLMKECEHHGLKPFLARKESLGLIANRIWAAIKRESLLVVSEGISTPQEIDELVESAFGLRPFAKMDIVGLDVVKDIEEHYLDVRTDVTRREVIDVLDGYIEEGRLGVKTGQGFYTYP